MYIRVIMYDIIFLRYYNQSVTAIIPYHIAITIVTDIHVLE